MHTSTQVRAGRVVRLRPAVSRVFALSPDVRFRVLGSAHCEIGQFALIRWAGRERVAFVGPDAFHTAYGDVSLDAEVLGLLVPLQAFVFDDIV